MQQLQNGVYTFTLGEKEWGEEANQNFETLNSLIDQVEENSENCEELTIKAQTNTNNIERVENELTSKINETKSELLEKIDILNNNNIALNYKFDNLTKIDNAEHSSESDVAILAYKANIAKKLENSLSIGNITFDGSANITVSVDGIPTSGSSNLINSSAVYSGLETKANKATTINGYNISDAYTKSEINNLLTQGSSDSKSYTDTEIAKLINSAPETLDTLNELSQALGNDPDFATTVSNQIGLKSNDSEVVHLTGNETINGVKTFNDSIEFNITKEEISAIIQ